MNKFLSEEWQVFYRKRKSDILNDTDNSKFNIIRGNFRYWCADPFIIEENGKAFVFAEMYDRLKHKGAIGYCILSENGNYSPWKKVLECPWHLSYPFIYKRGGDFYMIPESYVSGKVSIYKAAAFPEKWEEIKVIANCPCVDTTIQEINNKKYIFTTICENEKTVISSFNDEMFDPNKAQVINNKYNQARSAGKFFTHDEMLIRPAQDCTGEYGKAINLYIPAISNGIYSEKLLKKITADQINTNERIKAAGIHTYNLSEHYEVIDIKRYSFNLVWFIIRPFDYLKRRINRLFNDRNKENNS